MLKINLCRTIQEMPPVQCYIVAKSNHFWTPIFSCVKSNLFRTIIIGPPFWSSGSFQDPLSNMTWQICQQLTTAHLVNKTLATAKCQTPGTKLYIRRAPSESQCRKRESRREVKRETHSRSLCSDPDARKSCPAKAKSCKNRCLTHTGAIPSAKQDMNQKVIQINLTDPSIYMLDPLSYTNIQMMNIQLPVQYTNQRMNILIDYQCTPMPTFSPPCNTEDTPPIPCPRSSRTHPILLPRPSKVINNNSNSQKPTTGDCQKLTQRTVVLHTPTAT